MEIVYFFLAFSPSNFAIFFQLIFLLGKEFSDKKRRERNFNVWDYFSIQKKKILRKRRQTSFHSAFSKWNYQRVNKAPKIPSDPFSRKWLLKLSFSSPVLFEFICLHKFRSISIFIQIDRLIYIFSFFITQSYISLILNIKSKTFW